MTTIAANMKCMASDTMVSDDVTDIKTEKIEQVGQALVGCAGNLDSTAKFLEWLHRGCKGRKPALKSFEALVLTTSGLFYYNESRHPRMITEGFAAIGTGTQAAMAKLREGGGPRAAVAHACRADKNSEAPIRVRYLKGKR